MKNKKIKILSLIAIPIAFTAIISAGFIGIVKASGENNYLTIVEKIAEKFNLDKNEVQAVFDEEHEERQQLMQQKQENRLDEFVDDGTITEEQKNLIIEKHEEMQANREANRDLDPEERHEAMEQEREEFENWAEENGIDLSLIGPFGGPKGKGMGIGMGQGCDCEE